MSHAFTVHTRRVVIVLAAMGGAYATLGAQDVTFARDVAPILQLKCQVCHRPGSIAPMSLLTYEDARKSAKKIRAKVSLRTMPPWHIDKNIGIQEFKNDRSLSDQQVATIVRWVDGGAPLGDPADLPPPARFPDPDQWQLATTFGPPDLLVRTAPFTVPARGQDKWVTGVSETGLQEPRWVRGIEVRPRRAQDRKVVHHVLADLVQREETMPVMATSEGDHPGDNMFVEWAVGKLGEVYPPDAGKLMLPGSRMAWNVHFHPNGTEVNDSQVEIAVYFFPRGVVPRHRVVLTVFQLGQFALDIPPGEKTITQNFFVLPGPARLDSFQPHMHLRGKAMSLQAILPDGSTRVLSAVNNFQWNWLTNYVYADDAAPLLPKGTVLAVTSLHDNTADNPSNPDPTQWVGWGARVVDEMAACHVNIVYLTQAEFDALVAARKMDAARRSGQ